LDGLGCIGTDPDDRRHRKRRSRKLARQLNPSTPASRSLAPAKSPNKSSSAKRLSRLKDKHGYSLFHGNNGKDYAMPRKTEGGKWLVGALLTTELESSP
jgi:hypothetical protein